LFRIGLLFTLLFCFNTSYIKAQKAQYKPTRIGFMYGYGEQSNFLLKNKDYSYSSNTVKLQLFYPLKSGKFSVDLLIEPTIGFAKHQLLNFYFIEPDEPDYLAKREEFTKSKLLTEYILSNKLVLHYKVYKSNSIYILAGVGPMFISKRTERLAKGFAFSETVGLGLSLKISKNIYFDIRGNLRHLSNAELRKPNSGINIVSFESGLNVKL
jgi:Lipid A 3-O-deacylase (PagL)